MNIQLGKFFRIRKPLKSHENISPKNSNHIIQYIRTSIIWTPVYHFNVKGVKINEFVSISGLSDKIHYLFCYVYTIMFQHIVVNHLCGRPVVSHMLICSPIYLLLRTQPIESKNHTGISFIFLFCRKSNCFLWF